MDAAHLLDAQLVLTDLLGALQRRRERWVAWNADTSEDVALLLRLTTVLSEGGLDLEISSALQAAVEQQTPTTPVITAYSDYGALLDAALGEGDALLEQINELLSEADGDGLRPLHDSGSSRNSRRDKSPNRRSSYKKNVTAG